jgi:ubiquinone/menaquinone biosynthesis C-methylase UbiE
VDEPFQKDLSHSSWDEVYARQAKRADLLPSWLEALQLKQGGRVLDVGAGPGYVSLVLAERVGQAGLVIAIERSPEALAYLERLQTERGISQIRRIVADAATLERAEPGADSALITLVLHHAEDAAGIVRNVYRLLAPEARAVIAEFHPEGPCRLGAPQAHRLQPEQVQAWCESAGFAVLSYDRQTPEHYMFVVQRPA